MKTEEGSDVESSATTWQSDQELTSVGRFYTCNARDVGIREIRLVSSFSNLTQGGSFMNVGGHKSTKRQFIPTSESPCPYVPYMPKQQSLSALAGFSESVAPHPQVRAEKERARPDIRKHACLR